MTGRPCTICSSDEKIKVSAEMIGAGASDQVIADRLGVGRMSVQRHRQSHVLAPAKALAEAAGKGQAAIEQRAQVMAAAEAGDPSAFVALAAIVADLRRVHERLERTAGAAEQDNQRLAVASLSAQQLRAAEVRAKIGGVGGYAPARGMEATAAAPFSITFNFANGSTERITTVGAATAYGAVVDSVAEDVPATRHRNHHNAAGEAGSSVRGQADRGLGEHNPSSQQSTAQYNFGTISKQYHLSQCSAR